MLAAWLIALVTGAGATIALSLLGIVLSFWEGFVMIVALQLAALLGRITTRV
jgi:hypothetical protein